MGAGRASGSRARTASEAIELLREVRAEMDARYRELLARGLRKVRREDGLPLHLVVVRRARVLPDAAGQAQRQEFAELLRDLVARGRAAGVIVCAATQKPGADVVPSALRDLFGFRLALRCNTPQASDTILGQGWASAGADASTIPGGQRGVGYLLAEGERPVRIKGFYLGDDDVAAIAERAAARRADAWLAGGQSASGSMVRAGWSSDDRDSDRDGRAPVGPVLERGARAGGGPGAVGALRAPAALDGLLPAAGAAARAGRRDRHGDGRGAHDRTRPSASPTGRC